MSAHAEFLPKIFSQRADVCTGRTHDAHSQIMIAVVVRREPGAIVRQTFELTDVDEHRFSFNLFATPREFVKLSPADLLSRVHRWSLLDLAAEGSYRLLDFFSVKLRVPLCLGGEICYASARGVSSISRIAQTNHSFIFLLGAAQELRQPRSAADQHYQKSGRKR